MKKRLHIAIFGDADSIHVVRWASSLQSRGLRVSVLSLNPPLEKHGLYEHYSLLRSGWEKRKSSGGNWYLFLKAIYRAKKLLRWLKPDIIHAHYLSSYGILASLVKSTLLVGSAWGTDVLVFPHQSRLKKIAIELSLKKFDRITGDSLSLIQALEILSYPVSKTVYIPFGVQIEEYFFKPSMESGRVRLLSNRTLDSNSNISVVIKATQMLIEEGFDCSLTIANSGPLHQELEDFVVELGMSEHIHFVGKVVPSKMIDLLNESEIFVSIPSSDGSSVSLLEAMAVGCYPVVSDVVSNREWITSPLSGAVLDKIDEASLFESIRLALKNRESWKTALCENRRAIEHRANWNENVEMMEKVYRDLISSLPAN